MNWGAHQDRRLILRPGTGESAVAGFAADTNAQQVQEITATPELGLVREVTWRVAPSYYLHFGTERFSSRSFVQMSGPVSGEVANMTHMLIDYFEPFRDDELLATITAAESVEESRAALVQAGLGAPRTFDQRFFGPIRAAMLGDDPGIREAGLWAALYALWPEFHPLVREMAASDDSVLLRDQAQALREYMEKEGITL